MHWWDVASAQQGTLLLGAWPLLSQASTLLYGTHELGQWCCAHKEVQEVPLGVVPATQGCTTQKLAPSATLPKHLAPSTTPLAIPQPQLILLVLVPPCFRCGVVSV